MTIEVRGVGRTIEVLTSIGTGAWVADALRASLYRLQDNAQQSYPNRQSSGPYPWVSERQRRYVMAAIRDGRITVPYRRTRRLGKWEVGSVTQTGRGWSGSVGPTVDYARYVMNAADQAQIHQGNWPTIQRIATSTRPAVIRIFEDAARKATE